MKTDKSRRDFDELNNLLTEYYEMMDISKEQKLERIELAEELFDVFLFLFTYIDAQISASVSIEVDRENIKEMFSRRYADVCEKYGINLDKHNTINDYINNVSSEMVDTTFDGKANKDIQERALIVAENESNTIFNCIEYDDAVSSGKYVSKTWITENDDRVRHTHSDIDFETIPVDEPFMVGESQMMFPRDWSMGASVKEIVNCRCSIRYNKILLNGIKVENKSTNGLQAQNNSDKISSNSLDLNLQFFAEKDIKNQSSDSLKRAIRKYTKRIEEHNSKISNPDVYIPNWSELDERQQNGLIKHWNKEIRVFNQSIEDRISELKLRGDLNE